MFSLHLLVFIEMLIQETLIQWFCLFEQHH